MQQLLQLLIQWYHTMQHNGGLHLDPKWWDPRDFKLKARLGGYQPKATATNNATKILSVKNQMQQNTCVVESGTSQKEPDEGVLLDRRWMASYLRNNNLMDAHGTSLSFFQKALHDVGEPAQTVFPNYDTDWVSFANPNQLTPAKAQDALTHRTSSFFSTFDLEVVLEQLDNGRIGQTGGQWYTGYNGNGLNEAKILEPRKGYLVGGHAYDIVDYNLSYCGNKVLKCLNSYSDQYGDHGYFYIKFEDFATICSIGVYFNSPMTKDVVGFLSLNQGRAVIEQNGPKVYFIDHDQKRYIPDEALMTMLNLTPAALTKDTDGILPSVKDGPDMGIADIPVDQVERTKYFVQQMKDQALTKDRYSKYFPDLFTN